MRDIRADLRERLEVTARERSQLVERLRALEARERCLRALLTEEELPTTGVHAPPPAGEPHGTRLREFVFGSLADGHDWSLEQLKEHARGIGLMTIGATGRSLNITLVNLLREGLVARLPNGRWRRLEQGTQLPLDLAS
jgi:hypothetical protein